MDTKIDSSNFHNYNKWINKSIKIWDYGYLVNEVMIFGKDFSFSLSSNETKIDRLYLFRLLLDSNMKNEINANYFYRNNIIVYDSTNILFSLRIESNKIYFNKF